MDSSAFLDEPYGGILGSSLADGFLNDVRGIIERGRREACASVNSVAIETYWKIGERIVKQEQGGNSRAGYGKQIIEVLSSGLRSVYGEEFSPRRLREYRRFYLKFKDFEIWHSCVPNLTWTHFRMLLQEEGDAARLWYMRESAAEGWNVRTLQRNISTQYYYRLLRSPKSEVVEIEMKRLAVPLKCGREEYIKSPVIAEFLGLTPNSDFSESDLEKSVLNHLQHFVMEMGKGYAFVARQKHIHTDAGDYFIDLVFYNYLLRCFVLIDLKTSQVSHQDVGQMDMYVRMFDELYKKEGHNPTIGLLLCSDTSKDIAKYSVLHDSEQLFTAKYLTYIPTQEELQAEIEKQKEIFRL